MYVGLTAFQGSQTPEPLAMPRLFAPSPVLHFIFSLQSISWCEAFLRFCVFEHGLRYGQRVGVSWCREASGGWGEGECRRMSWGDGQELTMGKHETEYAICTVSFN